MKPLDAVTVVAAITIAAFAIDRIVTAFLFLASYRWQWAHPAAVDSIQRADAEKNYKLAYYVLASILGLLAYSLGNISVFFALGLPPNLFFDAIVTVLVLVGGSDRVGTLLKAADAGASSKSVEKPVEVTGTLTLVPPLEKSGLRPKSLRTSFRVVGADRSPIRCLKFCSRGRPCRGKWILPLGMPPHHRERRDVADLPANSDALA